MTVAAHNCQGYGVNLTLYVTPDDWDNKLERQFKVTGEDGTVTAENELVECKDISTAYKTCLFYLAPDNPRFGMMMSGEARGLLTYSARWVAAD